MAEKEKKQTSPPKKQSLFTLIIFSPIRIMLFLVMGFLLACIISIIIEMIGLHFWWPDNPHHAQEMFLNEFRYIENNYAKSFGNWQPFLIIKTNVSIIFNWFANSSTINYIVSWWLSPPTSSIGEGIKTSLTMMGVYAEAIVFISLTIAMRITIFILSSGWFLLCALIGLVNGLILREIRRAEGGLEHSFLFHLGMSHLGAALKAAWIIYLSIPFVIHPSFIIIPTGIMFGSTISLTASTFKKYL